RFDEAELTAVGPCRRNLFAVLIDIFNCHHFRRSVRRARIVVPCRSSCWRAGGVGLAQPPFFSAGELRKVAQTPHLVAAIRVAWIDRRVVIRRTAYLRTVG